LKENQEAHTNMMIKMKNKANKVAKWRHKRFVKIIRITREQSR